MDNNSGTDSDGNVLPPDGGTHGPDTHHRCSPTAVSLKPSKTPTPPGSGGSGSGFSAEGKGTALEGLPEIGPLPPPGVGGINESKVPNITVPADHPNRTLVLCFDGTDQLGSDNSNIVELFSILKKDDPSKQLVYYQAGIGAYTIPQIATSLMARISKALDKAIAWSLDTRIISGYEFLMQNYKAGDKICIFGFSHGAYIARCLVGMLHKVGLLPRCHRQQVPFAYKMYARSDLIGWRRSNAFKAAFSIRVDIDFLGVWDTVCSVGIIPRRLPFTSSDNVVRVFRHAIALDERRAKFKQNTRSRPNVAELRLLDGERVGSGGRLNPRRHAAYRGREGNPAKRKVMTELEREAHTDVEEVWFAGCHCDVGGGSVSNGTRPNLARIPLRWMIRQTFLTKTGIMFSARGLRRIGLDLDPDTYHPILVRPPPLEVPETASLQCIPRKPLKPEEHEARVREAAAAEADMSEGELELRDALSPIYDPLNLSWSWWILELLPMRHRYRNRDGSWVTSFGPNMGRGRFISHQIQREVKVHRSVKMRFDACYRNGEKYQPKARLIVEPTWVD